MTSPLTANQEAAIPALLKFRPIPLTIALATELVALFWNWHRRNVEQLTIAAVLFAAAAVIFMTPSLSLLIANKRSEWYRAMVELLLYIPVLLGIGSAAIWLEPGPIWWWAAYPVVVLLTCIPGSRAMDDLKRTVASYVVDYKLDSLREHVERLSDLFHAEAAFYFPPIAAAILSGLIGLATGLAAEKALRVAAVLTAALVILLVAWFMLAQVRGMTRAMDEGISGELEGADFRRHELEVALAAMNIRDVYFYDATHNLIIVLAFAVVGLRLARVHLAPNHLFIAFVCALLAFAYLPYWLGQSRIRHTFLRNLRGLTITHELTAKLDMYLPVTPKRMAIKGLALGVAGNAVYAILNGLMA